VKYKKAYGNCEVSKKITFHSYGWVIDIRRAHRRKCQGLPTSNTPLDEWVQRLNELGFVWSKPSNKGPGGILDDLSEVKEDFDVVEKSDEESSFCSDSDDADDELDFE